MSKSLEQAYKELARDEAPDLWNRIETGLKDRTEVTSKSAPIQRKSVLVFLKKYSGAAAAVLCAAILIPAIIFMERADLGDKKAAVKESAACDNAAPAEAAEIKEESATMEAKQEAFAKQEEADEDMTEEPFRLEEKAVYGVENAERSEQEEAVAIAEAAAGGDDMQQAKEESSSDTAEQKRQEAAKLQDGCLLSGVQVMITEEREGAVYYVLVEKDDSGTFKKGEKIRIFRPADASFVMEENESITLELKYSEKDRYFVAEQVSGGN